MSPEPPAPAAAPALALRPMSLGDVLDGAFKLLVAAWRELVLVAAVFIVPVQLLSAYLERGALGGGLLGALGDPAALEAMLEAEQSAGAAGSLVTLLDFLLLLPVVTGALAWAATRLSLGEQADAADALRVAVRRAPALIGAWVLALAVGLGPAAAGVALAVIGAAAGLAGLAGLGAVLVLLGLPVALVATGLFAAAPAAVVVEGLGPVAGLRRSARLLGQRLPAVVGILLLAGLVAVLVGTVLSGVPTLFGFLAGERLGWMLVALGSILSSLVTIPVLAIVVALVYLDARARREGLDLRVRAGRLALVDPAAVREGVAGGG